MITSYHLGNKHVNRIGFGAMQLAGPGVFGGPSDVRGALRRAVELGVDHIDTAQYYGPDVVNDLIREALYPYPEHLSSSPRSERVATATARGCRRCPRLISAKASRTTCGRCGSSGSTW
jgi:diketogulonate reductase-like aldo/keto reductase